MTKLVICINNKLAESILTVNKVYEVKRENDVDTIVVVGDDNIRYVMPRAYFNKISVIKKVRYTKEPCAYVPTMYIGEVYEVVEETKDGFYIVINSKRITTRVPKSCFEDEQVEDKVICIKAGGNGYITEGREYEVVGCREQEYGVINNIGEVFYYPKSLFKPIKSNRNISVNLTFDTTELQAKLEKALYHLKELNKVMDEIGEGDIKVKVD